MWRLFLDVIADDARKGARASELKFLHTHRLMDQVQAAFGGRREVLAPSSSRIHTGRTDMLRLWRTGLTRVRLRLMAARCLQIEGVMSFASEYAVLYERHNEYLAKLRTGVKAAGRQLSAYNDVRSNHLAEEGMQLAGKVATEVTTAAELADLAFWQQGDASLYTTGNVQRRTRLRHSDACVEVLDAFWRVAKTDDEIHESDGHGGSSDERVVREGYSELYLRVHKTLLEAFSLDEALKDVEDDWRADARGRNALTREPFADSLFELADSTHAHTCCATLDSCCRRRAHR